MKLKFQQTILFFAVLFLFSCESEKSEPLPELTYFGTEPRVQNPLSPEDSQKHIQLPKGFTAELYAAEPNIINPIAFAWDERSRLWVVQSMDYPHDLANDVGGDRITICEDTDGDGKADKFIDFATEQSLTTGITIVKNGVIVAQAPEMVLLEDTDGDDKMDKRTVLFDGFGTWDTHAGPANLRYGHDNMIWGSVGYSGFQNTFQGNSVDFSMGVYRFSEDGQYFEPVGKFNNNTWGMGFMEDFEVFGSTANNNHACYVGIPLRYYDYLSERPSWAVNADFIQGHYEISPVDTVPLQQVDVRGGYTAAAGANFYLANNYPRDYRNQMYVNAPTGHLVHIARMEEAGAGYKEVDGGNIFASTDAWTAPVFTETGPDGNLWVADWYNPVIQHNPDARGMENQIWNDDKGEGNAHLNPLRDKKHGRIYVVKYKAKTSGPGSLDVENGDALLSALESSNAFWRVTAQRLIVEYQKTELIPSLIQLADKQKGMASFHALWSLDGLTLSTTYQSELDRIANACLTSNEPALRKAGLDLLESNEDNSDKLVQSGILDDDNLMVRRNAILKASELPETPSLFDAIERISQLDVNRNDKWLDAALKVYQRTPNNEDIQEDEIDVVIPSSEEEIVSWKYSEREIDGWFEEEFDDSNWQVGEGIFSTEDLHKNSGTVWNSSDIWLRREVDISSRLQDPVLKILYDEDYEVYVNGKLLHKASGWTPRYELIGLGSEKARLFKRGKNILAVHCKNEYGNQWIDVGIADVADFRADKEIVLNTVPQKMAYDKTVIHAMAGQKLALTLINTDQMPHNVILLEKGSLDIFGKLVDDFLKDPKAAEMEYIPQSRYVIAATKMLDPEESETLRIQLPDEPGEYPYICTYPGHWQIMQGTLVLSNKGSYLTDNTSKPNIAVMGGGGSHEFEKYFGVADGKILHQNGANNVRYTEISEVFGSNIGKADVLVISNNKPFDTKTKFNILNHVNTGYPMLIYHPSTWYNWTDWPEYNQKIVSGGSRSHERLQEFEVRVVKPNHPIMKDVPRSFRITDELYRWEKDPSGPRIEVLAVGRGLESGEEYPVVWVVKHPMAKIVCNTLGHDADAHDLPAYQTILNNSLNFVKGKRKVQKRDSVNADEVD